MLWCYSTVIREKLLSSTYKTAFCYVAIVYGYYNSYNLTITGTACISENARNGIRQKKKKFQ